jgi:hypothetical protein
VGLLETARADRPNPMYKSFNDWGGLIDPIFIPGKSLRDGKAGEILGDV